MTDLTNFYIKQEEPYQSCFLALREIISTFHPNISETVKYGMPCFVFGKKALCYLWKDKKTNEPYVLFVEGKALNHPELIQGDRARMKTLPINASADIPLEVLNEILKEAIGLYTTP